MHKATAVISIKAIENNALFIRKKIGDGRFFAVVKADAYGHGAEEVALKIEHIVDCFCVAINSEGAALRVAGVTKPILVFTPPLSLSDASEAAFYDLTPTVNDKKSALFCANLRCHIKVNTGMNRVGCNIEGLEEVLSVLSAEQIEGVYSHMYAPDDEAARLFQLELFKRAVRLVKSKNSRVCAHFSSSAGILAGREYAFDGARAGILLYGYAPRGFTAPVERAMKIFAPLVQSTTPVGDGAGYGKAKKKCDKFYTYRYGYADGLPRACPLGENPLCMDGFVSSDGGDLRIVLDNAEDIAKKCGTISYEILCSAARRCEKVYER